MAARRAAAAPVQPAAAVTAIAGYVYDFNTGAALVGATVTTVPETATATTGAGGAYQITDQLEDGTAYQVIASSEGYQDNFVNVTAAAGVVRTADIGLTPATPELRVSVQTIDFGENNNSGYFLLRNYGPPGSELIWEATVPAAWVTSIEPSSGVLVPEDGGFGVTVTVDRAAAGGVHGFLSALLTVVSNGGVELVDLRIRIPDPDAPQLDYLYEVVEFGSDLDVKTVTVSNAGTAELTWSAAEDMGWLAVSPTSGALQPGASEVLTLTADRTGLAAGSEHAGYIAFESNSAVDDAIPLRVHLAVPHEYAWNVGPTSHDLGLDLVDAKLSLENLSSETLSWTSESSAGWLRAVPSEGRVALGDTVPAYILIDRSLTGTGPFSGQVTLRSAAGDVVIDVSGEEVPHPILKYEVIPPIWYHGQAEPRTAVYLTNSGSGDLNWRVTSTTPWVSRIEPETGASQDVGCWANTLRCGDKVLIYADPSYFDTPEDAEGAVTIELTDTGETVDLPFSFNFRDHYWETLDTPPEMGERILGQMVYDPVRDRAVLFGGERDPDRTVLANDTWEFDGQTWTQISTATVPPARSSHAMVFDRRRGVVVMWSGYAEDRWEVRDDTWEYDGSDWLEVAASGSPVVGGFLGGSRFQQLALFDPTQGDILFYGRADGSEYYGDKFFWRFDGSSWTEQPSPEPPPTLRDSPILYWRKGRPVLQGAILGLTQGSAGAWTPDDQFAWKPAESIRYYHGGDDSLAVHDPVNDWYFRVGGDGRAQACNGDEWCWGSWVFFSYPSFTYTTMTTDPPGRHYPAMALDTRRHRVLLAAGQCEVQAAPDSNDGVPATCIDSHALYLDPPLDPRVDHEENPTLGVTPAALDFGAATDALTLTVENTGSGTLDWIASGPPAGVTVDPDWGETGAGESTELTVSVDRAALGAGTHSLVLPVRSDGGNEDVTIDVVVE